MNRLLSALVMACPLPLRRFLAQRKMVQWLVTYYAGKMRAQVHDSRGAQIVINPVYHAQLLHHPISEYEPNVQRALEMLCQPGSVVYDVGANVGVLSCLAASLVGPSGMVVAFEPETNNVACLEDTIRVGTFTNLTLVPKAVGGVSGLQDFDVRGGAFSGRLVDHGRYGPATRRRTVETVSLDDYASSIGPPPTIVKIDVEGNELLVLSGMENLLRNGSPAILCELHSHLGDDAEAPGALLKRYGYQLFTLRDFVHQANPVPVSAAGSGFLVATK